MNYEGSVPATVNVYAGDGRGLLGEGPVSGGPVVEEVVQNGSSGTWACSANNPDGYQYTMSPGQTETDNIWVLLLGALTNSSPTFTPSPALVFDGTTIGGYANSDYTFSATGPNAISCPATLPPFVGIDMFSAPPFTVGATSCTAP